MPSTRFLSRAFQNNHAHQLLTASNPMAEKAKKWLSESLNRPRISTDLPPGLEPVMETAKPFMGGKEVLGTSIALPVARIAAETLEPYVSALAAAPADQLVHVGATSLQALGNAALEFVKHDKWMILVGGIALFAVAYFSRDKKIENINIYIPVDPTKTRQQQLEIAVSPGKKWRVGFEISPGKPTRLLKV